MPQKPVEPLGPVGHTSGPEPNREPIDPESLRDTRGALARSQVAQGAKDHLRPGHLARQRIAWKYPLPAPAPQAASERNLEYSE
jgi:hypothetical protein